MFWPEKGPDEFMWFDFEGFMLQVAYKMKYQQPELLSSLLNVLYMFSISIW